VPVFRHETPDGSKPPATGLLLLRFHYKRDRQTANFLAGNGQRGLERSDEVFGPNDGFGNDDFDFNFDAPAKRGADRNAGRKPDDSADDNDFWKHEPTRSIPRLGGRRKPAARTPRPPRSAPPRSAPPRSTSSRSASQTRASRTRATREHGETQQIPVIDADGVITLDDTACRPFDAATGLGGARPRAYVPATGDNSLMRRVGAMMLILALGVPVAMALRGGDQGGATLGVGEVAAMAATQATASTAAAALPAETVAPIEAPAVSVAGEAGAVVVAPETAAPAPAETAAPTETAAAPAAPAPQPVVAAPACVKTYTVELGDGWLRIANKHSVTMDEVLAANAANTSTFLMVGTQICVPANATTPTAAPATAPPVTKPAAPAYVAPFSLACAKTYTVVLGDGWLRIANKHSVAMKDVLAANAANTSTFLSVGRKICVPANATTPTVTPTTVKATPTTKAPRPAPTPTIYPPTRTYTAAEVEAIIREIWPDELEEEALRIAKRESRLNPRAQNYCCYGLFQIYFNVHKKWLAEMGITSGEQLLDPTTATKAGLKLYQRNGWGPWKL